MDSSKFHTIRNSTELYTLTFIEQKSLQRVFYQWNTKCGSKIAKENSNILLLNVPVSQKIVDGWWFTSVHEKIFTPFSFYQTQPCNLKCSVNEGRLRQTCLTGVTASICLQCHTALPITLAANTNDWLTCEENLALFMDN